MAPAWASLQLSSASPSTKAWMCAGSRRWPSRLRRMISWASTGGLFAVGDPDILDLGGCAQELAAFALGGIEPVARLPVRPRALHVGGRGGFDRLHSFAAAEVPQAFHVVVLGE